MATSLCLDQFSYQPLAMGHIRLLKIIKQGGGLMYELSHVNLDLAPKYSTLSYTWEGQAPDQDLLVNGLVLKVISNVKTALPYLFEKCQSQHLWIDGVCINQEDNREKEVQVPLMQKIYSQAAEGIVWLGEGNPTIDQAIVTIPTLVTKLEGYDYLNLGLDEHSLEAHGLPTSTSPVWQGLHGLFSRGWFTRVWTFQEAVLPKILGILCGRLSIKFDHLVALSLIMNRESGSLDAILNPLDAKKFLVFEGMRRVRIIQTARNQWVSGGVAYSFLDLLALSWSWPCFNPLDKIYGLLGVADQSLQEQVNVDYRRTPEELYLAFAKCWVPRDTHLQLLHMTPSVQLLGLPTWCPNFDSGNAASGFWQRVSTAKYRAGVKVGRTSEVSISADSRAIYVQGFRIDEIAEVVPCLYERQTHVTADLKDASIAGLVEWERKCLEISQRTFNTPQDVPDAHWRTLIANQHANGQYYTGAGREIYHLTKIMLCARTRAETQLLPAERLLAARPVTNDQLLQVQDFSKSFGYSSHGRSYFSTRGGRVGLGPLHTKPGDVVCILYNGYTPYILRPKPEDPTCRRNEFIGESYVDGLMYGESLDNGDSSLDEFFTLE